MTDEKKHNQSSPDQSAQANGSANASRRKALKTAGVAGGLAAGGIWHKPVVNAVALPAHAETSPSGPAALSGPTSDQDITMNFDGDSGMEIVDGLVDLVMPAAHAAVGPPPGSINPIFGDSRFRHCVSLDFPEGPAPSAPVNITVQGPTAYYAYPYSWSGSISCGGGYATSYGFNEHWDMNGFASTTLNGLDFEYNFGNFMVKGCITDSDFTGATGYLTYTDCTTYSQYGYYLCSNDTATFSLSPTGSCNVGSGNLSDLQGAYTAYCNS